MGELPAMAHPSARPPHLVVVDLRGLRQIPAALAALRRHHPDTGVVIVCTSLDPALMLEAMRAGITECVAEPLSADELQAAIGRVSNFSTPEPTGSVYAFIGSRGGVGTTTLAVNAAVALNREVPRQVLLVDLHISQGDASVLLGTEPRFSIVDALENTHRLDEAFFRSLVVEHKGRPALLGSSDRLLVGAPPADRIRSLLEFAASLYRYVILDLPRNDYTVLDALDGVSRLVVVANQELSAIRNAARLVTMLQQRYGRDRLLLALNRYDRQADITETDIQKVVGLPPAFTVPNDYRSAVRAANQGRPLVLHDDVKVSASIKSMARAVAGLELAAADQPAPGGSLFGRFSVRRT
jgi:pilus assembly protein CpaE